MIIQYADVFMPNARATIEKIYFLFRKDEAHANLDKQRLILKPTPSP